jgi:hypothetical protein
MIRDLFVFFKIIHGVFISVCTICERKVTIPLKALIGGTVIDVCENCLTNYNGKRIEVTEVDKIIVHTGLIRSIQIKKGD